MGKKRAVFSGSFNPFTNGHLDIVKQASELFDEVYVIIATNSEKVKMIKDEDMAVAMGECFKRLKLQNCFAIVHHGLIAEYCKTMSVSYLVRGIRNTTDYMYEENLAIINQELNPDLKTIYLRAKDSAISSTMVRELLKYNKDVSLYVPKEIAVFLNEIS